MHISQAGVRALCRLSIAGTQTSPTCKEPLLSLVPLLVSSCQQGWLHKGWDAELPDPSAALLLLWMIYRAAFSVQTRKFLRDTISPLDGVMGTEERDNQ